MALSSCLNKLFHSHEEEVGRGFKFLSSGCSCWLFPIRNLYKQDVQEGSLQQFLAPQIFFVFTCLFFFFSGKAFFFSLSPSCSAFLCFTFRLCSSLCSCADLLLCSPQLCLSCLGCWKQLVGKIQSIMGAIRKPGVLCYPTKKGPQISQSHFLSLCKFLWGKFSTTCLCESVYTDPIYHDIHGYQSQSK